MNTEHNKISLTKMDTQMCIWKRYNNFARKIFILDEKKKHWCYKLSDNNTWFYYNSHDIIIHFAT